MKTIRIKELEGTNFRGIKSLKVNFNDDVTTIAGKNGTGKTSVFNMFLWLLFGKDDQDRKDYDIKYRDPNGNTIDGQEVRVRAVLEVDGRIVTSERILREKWQTVRGTSTKRMTGNEHVLFWNDVPVSLSEFQSKVRDIIDENIFKLLTNINHFNSLNWKDRRSTLLDIAGDISDSEVWDSVKVDNQELLDKLMSEVNAGRTLDEHKKVVVARRNKAKEERDRIEPAIAEILSNMPDNIDINSVLSEKKSIEESISSLDKKLYERSLAHKEITSKVIEAQRRVTGLQDKLNGVAREMTERIAKLNSDMDSTINAIKSDVYKRVSDEQNALAPLLSKKESTQRAIWSLDSEIKSIEENIIRYKSEGKALNAKYTEENNKEVNFDTLEENCPTCSRPFDDIESKKAEIVQQFNENKARVINSLRERAMSLKKLIAQQEDLLEKAKSQRNEKEQELQNVEKEIDKAKQNLENKESIESLIQRAINASPQVIALRSEIDGIKSKLSNNDYGHEIRKELLVADAELADLRAKEEKVDNSESELIQAEKSALMEKLINIGRTIAEHESRERALLRIEELREKERILSDEIAMYDSQEFIIDRFTKAKMTMVENRVNSMFKLVKFRMFERQINEGERPVCDTLVNGVEWGTLNTGHKIIAGIDIINTLTKAYGISAPIFIDNVESVTERIDTHAQVIKLLVSDSHSQLTVI